MDALEQLAGARRCGLSSKTRANKAACNASWEEPSAGRSAQPEPPEQFRQGCGAAIGGFVGEATRGGTANAQ